MTTPSTASHTASKDGFGRTIDYLRIAITDRCNYRCVYCMPAEGVPFKTHERILTFEQIEHFVRIASEYGIKHLRLTGGEPLARLGCADLAAMLMAIPGIEDIAITTNGALLPREAKRLVEAGVSRVNISLDTLDPEVFPAVTRVGKLEDALAGIDAALEAGFKTVKVNCVAVRALHQDFYSLAALSLDRPLHVRFIEYMPIGDDETRAKGIPSEENPHFKDVSLWDHSDTIPSEELHGIVSQAGVDHGVGPLVAAGSHRPDGYGPADYWTFEGAQGTVGFISAMSNHFCASPRTAACAPACSATWNTPCTTPSRPATTTRCAPPSRQPCAPSPTRTTPTTEPSASCRRSEADPPWAAPTAATATTRRKATPW